MVKWSQIGDIIKKSRAPKELRFFEPKTKVSHFYASDLVHSTFGLYELSIDISTFCPLTCLGCLCTGGEDDFWLFRQIQMKKNNKAIARGIVTLGTNI